MACFYLIRHGSNDYLGHALAGRLPGVHLNNQGRREADWIGNTLAGKGIQRIISSPLDRCVETARPLAARLELNLETSNEIIEIDFGDWTGRTMPELSSMPLWTRFNVLRSDTRTPGGETILEVQRRTVSFLEQLRHEAPSGVFALFSHGDPIRSLLIYYLGMPIDMLTRLEVSPGSYSILKLEESGPEILAINRTCD